MEYVLAVTTPIYLLIAVGFLAVRLGWMTPADMRVLGRFTAQFGVPALLFRAISRQPLSAVLNVDYLAVYAAGSLVALLIVTLVAWRLRGRPVSLAALQGLGASGSNSAFIGYPIVLQVIGPSAGVALALCTLVENLLVMPLALAMADSGGGGKRPGDVLMSVLRSLLRNPMILAIFAGLFVSALGWCMPSVLDQTVSLAAAAASPTALFVIGGSLVGLQLTGIRGDIALIACGKLLLHPLCVLVFVFLFPPEQPLLRAAAILFAAMPMLSIYPVLAQRHGHERLCAAALLAATVSSFVSISLLIALLPPAWLPAH
jgi:malonate transporter and related proteins